MQVKSVNDMYTRLQEYNTSLQQYNSKLQTDLATANATLQRVEKEKSTIVENLGALRGHYATLQDQLTSFRVTFLIKSDCLLLVAFRSSKIGVIDYMPLLFAYTVSLKWDLNLLLIKFSFLFPCLGFSERGYKGKGDIK